MEKEYIVKREHHRIDVKVPFSAKKVYPEMIDELEAYAIGHSKNELCEFYATRASFGENIAEFLNLLNCKLDTIISLLTINQHGFSNLPRVKINLSGGGLSYATKELLKVGDVVEIKLLLDVPKPVGLHLYGEVIRVVRISENLYEIGVKFIKISEDLRDIIVRFVLHKEKEILRKRKDLVS